MPMTRRWFLMGMGAVAMAPLLTKLPVVIAEPRVWALGGIQSPPVEWVFHYVPLGNWRITEAVQVPRDWVGWHRDWKSVSGRQWIAQATTVTP